MSEFSDFSEEQLILILESSGIHDINDRPLTQTSRDEKILAIQQDLEETRLQRLAVEEGQVASLSQFEDLADMVLQQVIENATKEGCQPQIRSLSKRSRDAYDKFAPQRCKLIPLWSPFEPPKLPNGWMYKAEGFEPPQDLLDKTCIINFKSVFIRDKGVISLADLLMNNRTITDLDLEENEITYTGVITLANVLKTNRALISLKLDINRIGDVGAIALANALKINSTLTSISLRSNYIKNEGALALAEMLKENRVLTRLDLKGNFIDDIGINALVNAMKENQTLRVLDLRYNIFRSTKELTLIAKHESRIEI